MTPKGKIRARRRALALMVVTVLTVAVLLFAVFPTRSWWEQRQETAQVQGELAEVRAATARVEQEQEQLETDEEIARRAKEEFGYVNPGEESYSILPAPTEEIGLPEGWPFIGVERVFGTG